MLARPRARLRDRQMPASGHVTAKRGRMPPDRSSLLLAGDVTRRRASDGRRARRSSSRTELTYDTRHELHPDRGVRQHPLRQARARRPRPARQFERRDAAARIERQWPLHTLRSPGRARSRRCSLARRWPPRQRQRPAATNSELPINLEAASSDFDYSNNTLLFSASGSAQGDDAGGSRRGARERAQLRELGVEPDGRRCGSSCRMAA